VNLRGSAEAFKPTLVSGATTEAGVARSTSEGKTRNRVLALVVFAVSLCVAAFVAVRLGRKGEAVTPKEALVVSVAPVEKNAASAPPAAPPLPASAASPVASAPPTTAPSPAASAPVERAGHKRNSPSPAKAAGSSVTPSKAPTLPSSAPSVPAPAKTGHDIF
jgi:hypothetical protein